MNVSDHIRVSDLVGSIGSSDMDSEVKGVLIELIRRLDLFIVTFIAQVKKEPTIFTVNPSTNTEAVEGAKAGDVAIYVNDDDAVEVKVFS